MYFCVDTLTLPPPPSPQALMIREETVGEMHMDTALLYNNLGCCYDMLNRVTEAVESFQKAKDVFSYGVCVCVRACVRVCVCLCVTLGSARH